MVATRTAQPSPSHAPPAPTREMADWIAGLSREDITTQALTWAKHAVLDWLGVTIAGAHELKVCNIPAPTTGLEVKFSLRHTAALALAGEDTASLGTYSDAMANRPDLVALRNKVEVVTKPFPRQSPAAVDITLRNGATISNTLDVGEPAQDLEAQWARLTHKFHSLVDPILGADAAEACIDQCAHVETAMDLHTLLARASC